MSAAVTAGERKPTPLDQFRLLKRYPNFGLLWVGQAVSYLGDAFYSIALIWLVQDLTGSRAMMGAIGATVSVTALFGLVSGALVDRWDRRLTMFFSDVLRALVILSLPILAVAGHLEVWHLFVVGAGMGLLTQFFHPAKQALIPRLVPSEELASANALSQMAYTLLMAAGYGMGGALLGYLSASELFAFDAATFAVSAIAIWFIRTPRRQAIPPAAGDNTAAATLARLREDIWEGLRFIRGDNLIAATIPVAILANFIFAPMTVLTAAWAKDVLQAGAAGFGLLEGSFLIGSLMGILSASSLAARFRRGMLIIWGLVCMGLPLIVFALIPNLYLNIGALMAIGFVNGIVNITLVTLFQQRTPDHMLGRLFGTFMALALVAAPLGVALGGLLAEWVPLAYMFSAIGLVMAVIGLTLYRRPAVVDLI